MEVMTSTKQNNPISLRAINLTNRVSHVKVALITMMWLKLG